MSKRRGLIAEKGDWGRVIAVKDGMVTILWPSGKTSTMPESEALKLNRRGGRPE